MTDFLKFLLTAHIFLGVTGIILFYVVWMGLLKSPLAERKLRLSALWGVILFVLSWLTGGYYYATYYGKAVKPVIKAGPFPWAHSVIMEAKEHAFLYLSFLAIVICAVLYAYRENLESRPEIKTALTWLTGLVFFLGIIITLSGVVISGAVR